MIFYIKEKKGKRKKQANKQTLLTIKTIQIKTKFNLLPSSQKEMAKVNNTQLSWNQKKRGIAFWRAIMLHNFPAYGLGIYPKDKISQVHKGVCIRLSNIALFKIKNLESICP